MVNPSSSSVALHFTPLLDSSYLAALFCLGLILLGISAFALRKSLAVRVIAFAALFLILLNPSVLKEERDYVRDTAVLILDQSLSQNFGDRKTKSQKAFDDLHAQIKEQNNLDLITITAPENGKLSRDTRLFHNVDAALSSVPKSRRAGVIFITDGNIHDILQQIDKSISDTYGPVHTLLSGERSEKDRKITLINAPAYGLVGKSITVKYKIEDTSNINETSALVTLRTHEGIETTQNVPLSREQTFEIPVEHAGQNVFELSVDGVSNELTLANNTVPVLINGVRDRMKVLLVTGKPYAGERTWRDLLTSDPGVDLVHFTILREPEKLDYTPQNEMSLIAFPIDELFDVKLYDFDLIIFDQYNTNEIMPDYYFQNIQRFVREGGAFLAVGGPEFSRNDSIFKTPLRDILPVDSVHGSIEQNFIPKLNDKGKIHPVTRSLVWADEKGSQKNWGHWMRQVDLSTGAGDVLMTGFNDKPLLILNRINQGRVAMLASDQVWLWARGYDGGGPYAEMLRRIIHWLLKEPELDERAIDLQVTSNTIKISKQNIDNKQSESIAITLPDKNVVTAEMKDDAKGRLTYTLKIDQLGIYAVEDIFGTRKFALIGDINPPELQNVVTTDQTMKPLVQNSGGGILWLSDVLEPKIRMVNPASHMAGNNWIGLRRNNDYVVTGVKTIAFIPTWLSLLFGIFILIACWWIEGHRKSR